tara:strand:+ start:98 stop:1219 length:1122 start_codon:yes stop_codon:yes gene_type:complete
MKNRLHPFYLCAVVLIIFPLLASSQTISKEPKDLFVVGSESITFDSKINDKKYKLHVNFPENYGKDSTKSYPVFYVLDGQWNFTLATSIYGGIRYDGYVPEMIIVGITYGGKNPDYGFLRGTDLTPTAIADITSSGGAQKFLNVLSDEVIPMIDSLYRTDKTKRTLTGTSLGGLFAHYVLFSEPTLFNGYLINNSSFQWDNDYAFKLEKEFRKLNKSLNARVIFVSSEYDSGVTDTYRMVDQLKEYNYKNLALNYHMVKEMGHSGGYAEAISKGMRFIYKRPTIILPEEELKEYTGTYQVGEFIIEIVIRDGELTLTNKDEPDGETLLAYNKSQFSVMGQYLDFHFNRNSEGKVVSFFYEYSPSASITAIKVK